MGVARLAAACVLAAMAGSARAQDTQLPLVCTQLRAQAVKAQSAAMDYLAVFETDSQKKPESKQESSQRTADTANAALLADAALRACTASRDTSVPDLTARLTEVEKKADALRRPDAETCMAVLTPVQGILGEVEKSLQTGADPSPILGFLLDAAYAANTKAKPMCQASHGAALSVFAADIATMRKHLASVSACMPARRAFEIAVGAMQEAALNDRRAEYDRLHTHDYVKAKGDIGKFCTAFPDFAANATKADAMVANYDRFRAVTLEENARFLRERDSRR